MIYIPNESQKENCHVVKLLMSVIINTIFSIFLIIVV